MENMAEALSAKIGDFLEIIADFQQLLNEENQALRSSDLSKIAEIYPRKVKIVAAYRAITAFVIQHQQNIQHLDANLKTGFKDAAQTLDKCLHENEMLLKTRMETSKTVMNSIVNVAKMTNKSNATSYGVSGQFAPLNNTYNALTINRTL